MSINSRLSKLERRQGKDIQISVTIGETREQARKDAAKFLQQHPRGRVIFVGYEGQDEHEK